ncbi:MAG: hypothetical protein ACOC47_01870 [Alkalispirochaetaceae bacterium]
MRSHPRHPRRIARRLLLIALLAISLTACATLSPERGAPEPVVPRDAQDPWRQDLSVFERELPRLHYDLFQELSREEFRSRVAELSQKAPALSAAEFDLELRKILAAVGDSHTNLSWNPEMVYPWELHPFVEGIFCVAAREREQDVLGMRLVALDELPIAEVRQRFAQIIPHENETHLNNVFSVFLRSPTFLHLLGVTGKPEAGSFTFADYQGGSFTVELSAVSAESRVDYVRITERLSYTSENAPLYMRNSQRFYWQEQDEERRLLYIAYNSCREDPEYPMKDFVADVEEKLRNEPVETVVVDLRRNGGGSSLVLKPLISMLAEQREESEDLELYAFIGARTFSSAILNAIELQQQAEAVLVGEPTGGRPNHYGEVREFELPNLGAQVRYSTKYFQMSGGELAELDSLLPEIEAPNSFSALLQKRDPAMNAIGLW